MSDRKKITIADICEKVNSGDKVSMLSLYDYPFAYLAEEAGVDSIIVGDSVAMIVYGHSDTLEATMEMMLAHTKAVRQGAPSVYLIADMPYMSYQPSIELAIRNAGRFISFSKADAVKLEGGRDISEHIKALVKSSIPVVGHLGLLPQSAVVQGGFKVQAREASSAVRTVEDALILEDAGICMLILECVPPVVAEAIVSRVSVPVIGIGSGPACHGQVQLMHDILGLYPRFKPKFVKRYAELGCDVAEALRRYISEIQSGEYPADEHCYPMREGQQEEFLKRINHL